jgi:hypothetical protein
MLELHGCGSYELDQRRRSADEHVRRLHSQQSSRAIDPGRCYDVYASLIGETNGSGADGGRNFRVGRYDKCLELTLGRIDTLEHGAEEMRDRRPVVRHDKHGILTTRHAGRRRPRFPLIPFYQRNLRDLEPSTSACYGVALESRIELPVRREV